MNAQELKEGDWVLFEGFPYKVKEKHEEYLVLDNKPNEIECTYQDVSHLPKL